MTIWVRLRGGFQSELFEVDRHFAWRLNRLLAFRWRFLLVIDGLEERHPKSLLV